MPDEGLPFCELWDLARPPLPPRSRLYSLVPMGLGTPYVESLTSYVARLAVAHGVHLRTLVVHELLPLLGRTHLAKRVDNSLSAFWSKDARALNGSRILAHDWVQALELVTLRQDLRFLTWLTWAEVVTSLGLLRPTRAWCPDCYQEWQETGAVVYEPLLWTLQAVTMCPRHHRPLQTRCPDPHCRPAQAVLASRSHPGYCAHCGRWLGDWSATAPLNRAAADSTACAWSIWAAAAIGELLAAAPSLTAPPRKERIARAVAACVEQVAGGQVAVLARELGLSVGAVWGWLRYDCAPRLDFLLRLSYRWGVSPLLLLTADQFPEGHPRQVPVWSGAAPVPKAARRLWDTAGLRGALEAVLVRDEQPPPPMREIARRLGYSHSRLHHHYRELCRQISARYLTYHKAQGAKKREQLCAQVRAAAYQLAAQGVYPSAHRIAPLLSKPGFVRHPDAITVRHTVLRELGWER